MTARRSALLLVVTAAFGGLAVGLAYGAEDARLTAALLLLTGAPVLFLSHVFAHRRGRIGSLSRQFGLGVSVAIGLVLAGVGLVALLMFVSAHDTIVVALLLGFAAALALCSAAMVAGGFLRDVRAVRDGLRAVGEGARDVHIETSANDEIAEIAEATNRMIRQLGERERERDAADAARRELIAAVSHDLRTPLTSLRLLTEAIEDEVVDAQTRRRYLKEMSIHVRSLGALIDDLFELSRLEVGEITWSLQQVRLDELVEETIEAMRSQADLGNVSVRAEIPPDIASARGNPEKLQRVLFNLIQNAIHHTPEDGSITVRAEANDSRVEVEVADTGGGIAPEDRGHVFEPFFRGGAEAPRTRVGAGLGLTICRAIVEAHGGRIWLAESRRGAAVRFSLPLAG